jgi:hypothetical protein
MRKVPGTISHDDFGFLWGWLKNFSSSDGAPERFELGIIDPGAKPKSNRLTD